MDQVFCYRRLRAQLVWMALAMAALAVLIGWLAVRNQKSLLDFWFFLGFFGLGAAAFAAAALHLGGRYVVVSEAALSEKRPFRAPVSIAWSKVGRVTRFAQDRSTDVIAAGDAPVVTLHDQIDRFADLQRIVLDRAGERYAEVARRPGAAVPSWTLPALIGALFVGVVGWSWLDQGRVKVTVVDASGVPLPSAEVFFYNKRHPQPQDKADAAGFVERRLPAAPYYVSVSSRGFEPYRRRIEVKMLATEELRVTLHHAVF